MNENKTILVVEDNDFVRLQIVKFLTDVGFSTEEAEDGEAALTYMREGGKAIELAIVDVRMEPMGGFEFIRALRADDIATPVILVTGDQTPDLLERAGQVGVSAVLMKPVERERLVNTVERTIQSSERRG